MYNRKKINCQLCLDMYELYVKLWGTIYVLKCKIKRKKIKTYKQA